jgi:Phage Terminase
VHGAAIPVASRAGAPGVRQQHRLRREGRHDEADQAKAATQDGLSPGFISLDESHAQTFELRDVLVSAMGARREWAIWCPTTAGYDLTSVGYALRSTAKRILDGVIESDHSFVVLYGLDEADAWDDAATLDQVGAHDRDHARARLREAVLQRRAANAGHGGRVPDEGLQPLAALGDGVAVQQLDGLRNVSARRRCHSLSA